MFICLSLQSLVYRLRQDKCGAVATEYAFLVAFIAIVSALGMVLLGENLSTFFTLVTIPLINAGSVLPTVPGT